MIRPFNENDISNFPNIKILTHKKSNNTEKEYLLIERTPFIAAWISINNKYGIFIKQFRPIIQQTTIEIPMGKMESFETSPQETLIRELQEECNLFLGEKPSLLLKNNHTQEILTLEFQHMTINEHSSTYLSPGFSTSLLHPFMIELYSEDFHKFTNPDKYSLFSQEENLSVYLLELKDSLFDQLDGISRYYLLNFLYESKKKSL